MFVKFNHNWGRYGIGDVANIEQTLSRRLVGMGLAEYKTDMSKRTSPEAEKEEAPKVEKKPEPEEEKIEPEKEKVEPEEEKPKKKPKRTYKRPEKAVTLEK